MRAMRSLPLASRVIQFSKLQVQRSARPLPKCPDDQLGFGKVITDHMLKVEWKANKGWGAPAIVPAGPVISAASYSRLMQASEKMASARAQQAEREARGTFKASQRENIRQRGAQLSRERVQQLRGNSAQKERLRTEGVERKVARSKAYAAEQERRKAEQKLYEEHGLYLAKLEREQEERARAAVEAARLKREEETMQMRKELKELKESVDDTILGENQALVAQVRADTAHEKIRKAKTHFVMARWEQAGATTRTHSHVRLRARAPSHVCAPRAPPARGDMHRWDQADRVRHELKQFKAQRRDHELHYLAGAVALNQELDTRPMVEEARRTARTHTHTHTHTAPTIACIQWWCARCATWTCAVSAEGVRLYVVCRRSARRSRRPPITPRPCGASVTSCSGARRRTRGERTRSGAPCATRWWARPSLSAPTRPSRSCTWSRAEPHPPVPRSRRAPRAFGAPLRSAARCAYCAGLAPLRLWAQALGLAAELVAPADRLEPSGLVAPRLARRLGEGPARVGRRPLPAPRGEGLSPR